MLIHSLKCRRFPNFKPLSKLRGAIIRLDDYFFVLGGPNRSLCSIVVNKFDYVGAALSGTFRSPSNLSSTLSKHFSFQNQQLTRLNNHLINPNNLFLQNNQKKLHSPLRPFVPGRNSILNHHTASNNNTASHSNNTNFNYPQDSHQQKQTFPSNIVNNNTAIAHPFHNNNIQPTITSSSTMNQVQSNFFAPFLNVFSSTQKTNEKIPQHQPSAPILITEELDQTKSASGIEVFHHNKQVELLQQEQHQGEEIMDQRKELTKEITVNHHHMEDAQLSQNSFFVENVEDACEIPASQMEQLKRMEIPGFSNEESMMEIPIPSTQQLKAPEPLNSVSSITVTELVSTSVTLQSDNTEEEYTQRNESPSYVRVISTPHKRRTITGILSPDLEIPSRIPQKLEVTPSIIQSQEITSDNDSDDAMEDAPEIIPFSYRSGSVFSPSRYKNMAPPIVYLHSQNFHTQKAPSTPLQSSSINNNNTSAAKVASNQNTLEIKETPVKDIDEFQDLINQRNNRIEDESFDSSEDENEKYEAYMNRSLFRNPLHLEEHAFKKLEQRALPHHKKIIQARERRRQEEDQRSRTITTIEVETDIEITPDTMLEILKDPPLESRKRQIIEEKPKDNLKKQKTNPSQSSPTTTSSSETVTKNPTQKVLSSSSTTAKIQDSPKPVQTQPKPQESSKTALQTQPVSQAQPQLQQSSSNQSTKRIEKKPTEKPRKKANYSNWSAFL